MKAVILAAGVGSRLAPLTDDRPKALVSVAGTPILFRHLACLERAGIHARDVVIVAGYLIDVMRDAVANSPYAACQIVMNEQFAAWNNFWSLYVAKDAVAGHDVLQIDGDALLDDKILPRMINAPGDALIAVDQRDELDDETMKAQIDGAGKVIGLSKKLDPKQSIGEYIGVTKLTAAHAPKVFAELDRLRAEGLTNEYYEHAYHRLTIRGDLPFGVVNVHDCTVMEIDNVEDLRRAEQLLAGT